MNDKGAVYIFIPHEIKSIAIMDVEGSTAQIADTGPSELHLFAAGFNAHNQILNNDAVDVETLSQVSVAGRDAQGVRILFASWSSTAVLLDDRLIGLGHQNFEQTFDPT